MTRRYDDHARGTLPLPHDCLLGNTGDIVPGYVCCYCHGVELSEYALSVNHDCCGGSGTWRGERCTSQLIRHGQGDPDWQQGSQRWRHLWTDDQEQPDQFAGQLALFAPPPAETAQQLDLLDLLGVAA